MPAVDVLEKLLQDPDFREGLVFDRLLAARPGVYAEVPAAVPAALQGALRRRGIHRLYCHQAEAFAAAIGGHDAVVVTPTASGKTLCYNLPVLTRIIEEPEARALYIFPTKALAQDQLAELTALCETLDCGIRTFTYDGDTAPNARLAIREAGHVVITNPDMLHAAILPHHTKWLKLFQQLEYVVIDELHAYRGVFGSHLANVLRRLKRVCAFYGSDPTFVMASATIGNPGQLAEKILERPVRVIDRNGAPAAPRRLVFYNPPVVNADLGIRRSSVLEAQRLARRFIEGGAQTIVFGKSRLQVELLLTYLQEAFADRFGRHQTVRGYRGGYLPRQRREIERGLRAGEVRAVVATNALELGVDIGQMECAILCGYPGSIASTWQQLGRAGRRDEPSVGILVCSSNPVDQFLARHPEYFLDSSPEHGLIDADNLLILLGHLQAAVFEVPLQDGDALGTAATGELLEILQEQGRVYRSARQWHWSSEAFPAAEVSLRTVLADNVVIVEAQPGAPRVIGETDQFSAQTVLHEQAIYMHEGRQYHVDRLDWAEKKAYVHPVAVDYYTDADRAVRVEVLDTFASEDGGLARAHGEVLVTSVATVFKKIRLHTHEAVGAGPIDLPQVDLHSTGYWAGIPIEVQSRFSRPELQAGLHGLGHALRHVASVHLMCDPRDLGVAAQLRSPQTGRPTIFVYDVFPGGVGLSPRLFELHHAALEAASELIEGCPCRSGCPSCVGALLERHSAGKATALALSRAGIEPQPVGVAASG